MERSLEVRNQRLYHIQHLASASSAGRGWDSVKSPFNTPLLGYTKDQFLPHPMHHFTPPNVHSYHDSESEGTAPCHLLEQWLCIPLDIHSVYKVATLVYIGIVCRAIVTADLAMYLRYEWDDTSNIRFNIQSKHVIKKNHTWHGTRQNQFGISVCVRWPNFGRVIFGCLKTAQFRPVSQITLGLTLEWTRGYQLTGFRVVHGRGGSEPLRQLYPFDIRD